jgi:hypothetical protein
VLSQDMHDLSFVASTPADTSLDSAIRDLWIDALSTMILPSFHTPLSVIRHDFIVKHDEKQ